MHLANIATLEITSLIPSFDNFGAPIDPCINSEKTFARARGRLRECLSEHEDCKQIGTPPSRLLDVRQDKISLVNTESLHDPAWAALSYCWGGPQQAQTTHLNIQDRYQGIIAEELPLTIRDAIHVCRQMYIPYLWVDSLCIIQADSKSGEKVGDSDKDRELRKMAGIFSGAVLTISASSASSSEEGFLQDRAAWPPGIALPVHVNETYDIAQLVELPYDIQSQYDAEPADSRAWIFQEKALSCRTLNFVKLGMRLECRYTSRFIFQEDEYEYDLYQHISYCDWKTLVEDYSRRDLSDIRDRPIAIAAVAERVAAVSNELVVSDYAAGLWKPALGEDLLWYVSRYKSNRSIKLEGPSWSWTSTYASVNWPSFRGCSTTATIISTDVVLADPKSMFGATVSGIIRLRGRVTKTSRRITSCPRRLRHAWDREPETDGVFFLELVSRGPWNLAKRFGLMLQVTENPGEFVRVGCFSEWMPRECESFLNVSCKKCIEGIGRDDYVGWTCDSEERVIDII